MASQFLFRILEQRHDHTHLPALLSLLSRQKGRVPVSLPGPLVRRGGLRRRTDDPGRSTGAKCRSHLSFLWVAGIGCLLLVEVFIRIGCRNEARVDTAGFIRRHRRLPLNAEGVWAHYLLPIMLLYLPLFMVIITLTGMVSISTSALLWTSGVCVPVAFVLFRLQYRRLFFRWRKTVLPPERIDALLRELAEQYDWTIDHMDRDFFVAHTHPAWWSATWGEQIFVAHDRGGIWINSINDLGKRSSIVSFGYTRRNIRRVTEAITAQEKDIHSPI